METRQPIDLNTELEMLTTAKFNQIARGAFREDPGYLRLPAFCGVVRLVSLFPAGCRYMLTGSPDQIVF